MKVRLTWEEAEVVASIAFQDGGFSRDLHDAIQRAALDATFDNIVFLDLEPAEASELVDRLTGYTVPSRRTRPSLALAWRSVCEPPSPEHIPMAFDTYPQTYRRQADMVARALANVAYRVALPGFRADLSEISS